jgi:hypothetical protein
MTRSTPPSAKIRSYNVKYLGEVMNRLGLGGCWIYRNAP